jgi:hypothetical protein
MNELSMLNRAQIWNKEGGKRVFSAGQQLLSLCRVACDLCQGLRVQNVIKPLHANYGCVLDGGLIADDEHVPDLADKRCDVLRH